MKQPQFQPPQSHQPVSHPLRQPQSLPSPSHFAPQSAPATSFAADPNFEAQRAKSRKTMFIALGLVAGVCLSGISVAAIGVAFAIKNATSEPKTEGRRIEHAEFTFRMPGGWAAGEAKPSPVLFSFVAEDGTQATIQIESVRAWRGGPDFSGENFAQHLPGTSVRHQFDEMDEAAAVVGFSEEKSAGVWHCVAGTRHNGNDYFVRGRGPDREALTNAVFVIRKTWKWK